MNTAISDYIADITEQFNSGHAKEHAYRPALKQLLNSFDDIVAVNDPKRSEYGNPDFIFLQKSNQKIIRGYAEAKDITVSLDKTEKTNQMERYAGYANLFLTDYLEFRFFKNGEKYKTVSLGAVVNGSLRLTPQNNEELLRELGAFLELPPERIKSGKRLAQIMGGKARRIRDNVAQYLKDEQQGESNDELSKMYHMMQKLLVHDLSIEKFADMYAQTLVYGLFVARYNDKTPESFDRREAVELVPKSNPFLRKFFDHIAGADFDTRLGYIVDELCQVFSVSDVQQIVHKHLRIADSTSDAKDPIIHFYEDFLQEYDPAERKRMGAYYTPIPVVKFIVRQVDRILKEEFGIAKGLASSETFTKQVEVEQTRQVRNQNTGRMQNTNVINEEFYRVQVLDPAVGTATFLNETIKYIHEEFKGQEGRWPAYVQDNLIKRLHGFELMMAPYTIAHLKLGMTLQETGVENLKDRLGVYLTNTLEEGIPTQADLFTYGFAEAVSDESRYAAEIKNEHPIMVVMGNPPYSVSSNNKSKYIQNLIKDYKKDLNEKKINLDDDYIKFMRFAEDMIHKNGNGIVAMITNNSYLDGVTHRQMRKHLLQTFDKIYVLDLHGNTKKMEVTPDGGKDENVFDIMQGVSIVLMVKTGKEQAKHGEIYHAELYGKRDAKFDSLNSNKPAFRLVEYQEPGYYFVPKDYSAKEDYDNGIPLDSLFISSSSGVKTERDKITINHSVNGLKRVVDDFLELSIDDIRRKYDLYKESRDWGVERAKKDVMAHRDFRQYTKSISYRPFDRRYIYYTGTSKGFIGTPGYKTNRQMLNDNVGIVVSRQQKASGFQHVLATNNLVESSYVSNKTSEFGYIFPLYLYHSDGARTPNFVPIELAKLTINVSSETMPEDILDYTYAVLHSPGYRTKYKEFLKTDFPRIPVPKNDADFTHYLKFGRKLRELHLMKSPILDNYKTTYPIPTTGNYKNNIDGTPLYAKTGQNESGDIIGNVWINSQQYFGNVPEIAWNFYIGGYQPAQKWLKDRKGRELSNDDLDHYQKIIKVLTETDRIMRKIDDAY